jgi:hypothetical protein
MVTGLLHSHSALRYLVLFLLVAVLVRAAQGVFAKKPFQPLDNKLSLWLLIATHLQLLLGLGLYFLSDTVQFNSDTMSNPGLRYWAVEHLTGMLVAIVLITVGRISSKKKSTDEAKHRTLLIYNAIALLIIIVVLWQSGRGILIKP